jgi:hypothetical protein
MSKVHDLAVLSTSLRVSYENIPAESVRIAVAKTPMTEVYPVFRALGCKPASPQFGALRMASYSVKNKVSRRIVWPIIEPKAVKTHNSRQKKKNIRLAFGAKNEVYPGAIEERSEMVPNTRFIRFRLGALPLGFRRQGLDQQIIAPGAHRSDREKRGLFGFRFSSKNGF